MADGVPGSGPVPVLVPFWFPFLVRTRNRNREPGTQYALRAACHFERGATREGKEENALGPGPRQHQMRHTVRERVRFARSRARNDQQGTGPNCAASCCRGFSASMMDAWDTSVTIPRLSPRLRPLRRAVLFFARFGAKKLAVTTKSAVSFFFQNRHYFCGFVCFGGLRWPKPSLSARTTKRRYRAKVTGRARYSEDFQRRACVPRIRRPSHIRPRSNRDESSRLTLSGERLD